MLSKSDEDILNERLRNWGMWAADKSSLYGSTILWRMMQLYGEDGPDALKKAPEKPPDFLVLMPDGTLELHEVKGSPAIFADDAKVKVKACATQFPFPVFVVFPKKKSSGGGWDVQAY